MDEMGITDSPKKGPTLSTSTSSFEAFDVHDPNLSRLASKMFEKTGDYISHELNTTIDDYRLLENMNKATLVKTGEMKKLADTIVLKNNDLSKKYEDLKPMIQKIDDIEETVIKLEKAAYQLEGYTTRLENKFKALRGKK